MRVLLIGASGQIGFELSRLLPFVCDLSVLEKAHVEPANPDNLLKAAERIQPDWIINAAAYTKVEDAEANKDEAFAVNAELPGVIARVANTLNSRLVHFSTDYVFDGTKTSPYFETDPVSPINVYGASKAAGEIAVQQSLERHLILRTSWIYSRRRTNFLLTMERLIAERDQISVVSDQLGAPTSAIAVARATMHAICHCGISHNEVTAPLWGSYHVTCSGETSWHGFAAAIRSHLQGSKAELKSILSDKYKTEARRPLNSRLSNMKFESAFSFRMPSWREALDEVYAIGDS